MNKLILILYTLTLSASLWAAEKEVDESIIFKGKASGIVCLGNDFANARGPLRFTRETISALNTGQHPYIVKRVSGPWPSYEIHFGTKITEDSFMGACSGNIEVERN